MKRTAGSPPRRRRLFGAGSTATRESPEARTSSSRHAPSFAFTSSVLYKDDGATLDDLREAVAMMEEIKPTMRRVLGGTHPLVSILEHHLRESRAALTARETPRGSSKGSN